MSREASACPHCGAESSPWLPHAGVWWAQTKDGDWQWLDEKGNNSWRWYKDGTPGRPSATDRTPSRQIDPATVAPPDASSESVTQDAIKAPPVTSESTALSGELERLADLHTRGVLDDDEFNRRSGACWTPKRVLASSGSEGREGYDLGGLAGMTRPLTRDALCKRIAEVSHATWIVQGVRMQSGRSTA